MKPANNDGSKYQDLESQFENWKVETQTGTNYKNKISKSLLVQHLLISGTRITDTVKTIRHGFVPDTATSPIIFEYVEKHNGLVVFNLKE